MGVQSLNEPVKEIKKNTSGLPPVVPLRSLPELAVQTASTTPIWQREGWAGWGQPCPAHPNPGKTSPRSDRPGNRPGSACTGSRRRKPRAASPESQSPSCSEGPGARGHREEASQKIKREERSWWRLFQCSSGVTPAGCWKLLLVFSRPDGGGQALVTEWFPSGSGSVLFTMATMATLRLTRRP